MINSFVSIVGEKEGNRKEEGNERKGKKEGNERKGRKEGMTLRISI